MTLHEKFVFLSAASAVLEEPIFTVESIRRVTTNKEYANALWREYYLPVYRNPTAWPKGDQETRCLAFLLLIEFYS